MTQLNRMNCAEVDKRKEDSTHRSGIDNLKFGGGFSTLTTQITVGSQSLDVLVSTGRDITWLVTDHFSCEAGLCSFGPGFLPGTSATQRDGMKLNVKYDDGSSIKGHFVQDSATLAGLTVPKQTSELLHS